MTSQIRVTYLFVYPIKSLRGISQEVAPVTPFGLRHDRRFMLVRPDGTFITQRLYPELTVFDVEMSADRVVVTHPDRSSICIPVRGEGVANIRASVWDDSVDAFVGFPEADSFFSDHMREPLRLAWMPETTHRQTDLTYSQEGDRVSFADGYPILLVGQASMDDLNTRLEIPLPVNRFRPNIVVEGCDPWSEESWTHVEMPGAALRLVKKCDRCVVTTTDQRSGERLKEPLATLATFRKEGNKVWFGMNCIPDCMTEEGDALEIRVGDRVIAS